jgi:tetratricopeptide (TPR) repeat protein
MNQLNNHRREISICALLALVTLAAFWPVFQNDFIKLDDRQYVIENPHVLGGLTWENAKWAFQSGYASNWHPLTWLSHMLDVQLFGVNPGWHHFVNLLLHIANTVLLFLILKRMTGAVWRCVFVAALFAVHPLHVESVAWVAERKDVLSTFFFMLTLLAYVQYAEQSKTQNSKSRLWYAFALVLFALGLMSKPMLVTLPFILLLLDFWPLQRLQPQTIIRLALEKVPFMCLAAISSVLTFLAQAKGHNVSVGLPLDSRLANAIASYLKYLGKTIWPVDLAVFYPHPDIRYPLSNQWPTWQICAAALLLVLVSAFALLRCKRQPWFAVGWFWYLGALVPVIGIVQVGGQALADRYTYIPLIGVFICVVWAVSDFLAGTRFAKPVLATTGMLVIVACAATTHRQVEYWRNDFTLFEHTLAATSDNAVAHYHVGAELEDQGKYELALTHFRAALVCDPAYADAYCNMGYTLYAQGKADEAMKQYQTAIRLQPWHAQARTSLGAILWMRGQRDEALEQYTEALRLRPDLAQAHLNMGIALSTLGRQDEAFNEYAEAFRLAPVLATARYAAALNNRAWILATASDAKIRNGAEAVNLAEQACRLTDFREVVFVGTLAAAYAEAGRFDDAIKTGERAVNLANLARNEELVRRNRLLLDQYRTGNPYHEPPALK